MLARSLVKRMSANDKNTLRDGALYTGMITGAVAYLQYRNYISKEFFRSEAHYKFSQRVTNCTPWKQLYFTWWRMPEEEWTVYHRFKPYFLLGQLDLSKEVLIPRAKTINGSEVAGFDVINPIYCYEGGRLSFKNKFEGADPVKIERSAIIVNRGWIPAAYRDKRSRPEEVNSRQLVRLTGTWRKGKNVHEYKVPNNPDANEWNNLCLEDIGIYWDLPNFDEAKFYYFQAVDLKGEASALPFSTPVKADKPDEIIENHYGWRWNELTHQKVYRALGAVSAASLGVAFLTF